jgi:CheY-like chemotaxis protein
MKGQREIEAKADGSAMPGHNRYVSCCISRMKAMPEPARLCRKRILLVEDDPLARQSMKLLLMIDRHKVTEAENSQQALQIFLPGRFELVIVDYFMPQPQGDILAARIKQIDLGQPILMVTAFAEQLVESRLPVDGILGKPFGIEELRHAIVQVLSGSPQKPLTPAISKTPIAREGSRTIIV